MNRLLNCVGALWSSPQDAPHKRSRRRRLRREAVGRFHQLARFVQTVGVVVMERAQRLAASDRVSYFSVNGQADGWVDGVFLLCPAAA
jgi:hypothetical protein